MPLAILIQNRGIRLEDSFAFLGYLQRHFMSAVHYIWCFILKLMSIQV